MVKTISLEWLQSQGACKEAIEAWHKEIDHGTLATLNRLVVKNPEWGNWLICRIMNKNQSVQYAVFAAEQVIDIYEGKYPNDKRPRNAIEAAKAYLKNPSKKTKADAAYAAAYADDAYAAAYADAAYAAYAAACAGYVAYADAGYADYTDACYAANERRKMKAKILKYGIGLLKQEGV
ncbi:MAG: putative immunity protein [Bacteroidales bacterium]